MRIQCHENRVVTRELTGALTPTTHVPHVQVWGSPPPHCRLSLKAKGGTLQVDVVNHAQNPGPASKPGNSSPKLLSLFQNLRFGWERIGRGWK